MTSRNGRLPPLRSAAVALLMATAFPACATPTDIKSDVVRYVVSSHCAAQPRCFTGIQLALNASVSDTAGHWIDILIEPGSYYEKVTILRDKVRLRGQGMGSTRLHYDAVAQTAGHHHRKNWGTPGSATLTIDAKDVSVDGITIENSFDYLSNDARSDTDPGKISNSQAVALLLDVHSDRVVIGHAAIKGYQDTLFANGNRVLIHDSFISGNVDFIFGNGQVLIENSTVESRKRAPTVTDDVQSFIAAPSTQITQAIGIVVYRSKLTREDGVPDGSIALGRPWHPTTAFPDGRYADPNAIGQASFIDCYMDAHIHPAHWASMNGTARDGSKTAVFAPQDSRFSETGSYGPGARHVDIGIKWKADMDIRKIHQTFFVQWGDPRRK
ncbi:pectinesterase family protein [Asticcacaulis benevestitus]|nr:pectinesterase family protein [Asticcacaulis benevestitus]